MIRIDYKNELKQFHRPSAKKVVEVDVPGMNFQMLDGRGDPDSSRDFTETVEALLSVSYALKFMVKKGELAIDYGVMPLEGLRSIVDRRHVEVRDGR